MPNVVAEINTRRRGCVAGAVCHRHRLALFTCIPCGVHVSGSNVISIQSRSHFPAGRRGAAPRPCQAGFRNKSPLSCAHGRVAAEMYARNETIVGDEKTSISSRNSLRSVPLPDSYRGPEAGKGRARDRVRTVSFFAPATASFDSQPTVPRRIKYERGTRAIISTVPISPRENYVVKATTNFPV